MSEAIRILQETLGKVVAERDRAIEALRPFHDCVEYSESSEDAYYVDWDEVKDLPYESIMKAYHVFRKKVS